MNKQRIWMGGIAGLICWLPLFVQAQRYKDIPVGPQQYIRYDLKKGSYCFFAGREKLIADAQTFYDSTGSLSARHHWSVQPIADQMGKGLCYSFTAPFHDGLVARQSFYIYEDQPGFYTQVSLEGPGARSNHMSPLAAGVITPRVTDWSVQSPFDNDTWVRYKTYRHADARFSSAEITTFFDSASRNGLVIGSVEHNDWKTGLLVAGDTVTALTGWTDSVITRDTRPHGWITEGDTLCRSPRILVMYTTDWRKGLEAYGKANRLAEPRYIKPWTAAPPMGWNSWGVMQTALNLSKAKAVVDFFADSCKAFRTADHTLYIDLDSYWDNMKRGSDYSELKAFAQYCKAHGFKPGIYWAPFVDWGKNGDALVEGTPYHFRDCWTVVNGRYHDFDGARAMDPTHPATRAHIADVIGMFKDCGFEMVKIDFIGHAAIEADHFYDSTVHTGMQAFRKGMEFLVDQIDGTMLVYVAISPNLATGRYAHMRRIACDAFKRIDETAYTLNSTSLGWWLGYVYQYNDADHVVFDNESESVNRARLLSSVVTGTLITGDDYSTPGPWKLRARQLLQSPALLQLAQRHLLFEPVEAPEGQGAATSFIAHDGAAVYLAVFNYNDQPASLQLSLSRMGLDNGTYKATELFSGQSSQWQGTAAIRLSAADARIYRIVSGE